MKKWAHRVIDFLYDSMDQHIGAFAGQSTFFIFLSFFPLLNIIFAITPYLPFTEEQITELMLRVIPHDLAGYVRDIISDIYSNGAPTLTFFSVVIALWAAAKGLMAIRNGLNEIYHSREKKNYLVIRGFGAIYTLVFLVVLVILTMANLFGRQLYEHLLEKHEEIQTIGGLIVKLRGVGSFLLIFLMLWGMYTLMPNRKLQFRYQAPGAIFTSAAWVLVTWLFSYYIDYAMSRSAMYGSLTTIITILFWMYAMVNMIFWGAMINEFLYLYVYRERVERRAEKKRKIKAMRKARRMERKAVRKQRPAGTAIAEVKEETEPEEAENFVFEDGDESEDNEQKMIKDQND